METMIGIAVLLVGIGALWVCFAFGVYLFTRTGREGMRLARMAEQSQEVKLGEGEGENSAGISLVRSHFPSECAAPGVFEWVFRHPSAF